MKYIKTLLFIGILAFTANVSAQPAVLPAKVDVSAIGAATYTIPIEVVPGTNGIQPNLAIVYNSMAGLNVLGQKWGLQGISSITRVPQTRFYDGNITHIGYDTTDRFALDGNRMILFSGSTYQCNNAVYCFEIEDFSRIQKVNSGSGCYFTQSLSDGSVIEYGRDSQTQFFISGDTCMSWMVDKVIDVKGNYMKFHYQQGYGEIWIDHIDYTILSDGTPAYASVCFSYEALTTPNDGFVNGLQVRQSKRLKSIVVKYQGAQVRKYTFTYNTTLPNERLSSIKLYNSDDELLTTTTVNWNAPSSTMTSDETVSLISGGYRVVAGNFDDDRIYDMAVINQDNRINLIKKSEEGWSYLWYSGQNFTEYNFDNLSAHDIDGDGIDEIVYRRVSDGTFCSIKISPSGPTTQSNIFTPQTGSILNWGDFDGDGIVEPVAFHENADCILFKNLMGTSCTSTTFQHVYESCHAGDFDGDGKTDLVFLQGLNSHIYTYNIRTHDWDSIESNGFPNAYQYLVVGDFNGDGMSDLLFLPKNESYWKMAIRIGWKNWTVQVIPELNGSHRSTGNVLPLYIPIVCDINGDGKSDILQSVANNNVIYIISKGCYNGQFQYSETGTFSLVSGQCLQNNYFSFGDYDGNGITDIIFSNPNTGGQVGSIKYFYPGGLPGYFVNQISDAVGKKIKLEYSTISLMPNHYSGTDMHWMPLPLVKNLIVSNGLGGYDTTQFYYGEAQHDADKHQFIGFAEFGMKNKTRVSETFYSRVHSVNNSSFAFLMPDSVVNYITPDAVDIGNCYWSMKHHLANDILVSKTVNENNSRRRTNILGNTSFLPYVSTSTDYDYLKNTKTIKQLALSSSNWHPLQQTTTWDYIANSAESPSVQYLNYTYNTYTLSNGVSVTKPTKIITRHYGYQSSPVLRRDTVTYTYSSYGKPLTKTHSDNGGLSMTETFTYNAHGLPMSITTSHRGNNSPRSVTFSYDPTYRFITGITDHAGNVTQKTYDPATGLCLTETDINSLVTQHEYDGFGRLTLTTYPDATTRAVTYSNTSGGLTNTCCHTTVAESGRPETKTFYDCLGRKTHTHVAGQGYMDVVFNKLGQIAKQTIVPNTNTSITESTKQWKVFQYDIFGRVVKDSSNYHKNTYSYGYSNSNGHYYETVANKLGASSTKSFDAADHVVNVQDDGGSVAYVYDRTIQNGITCDRMQITTGGKTTVIVADSRGNRILISDPDAGTTTSTYDAWGNLLTQTDGKGDVTTMSYDSQGRVSSTTYSLNNSSDSYSYNYGTTAPSKGKVTSVYHNNVLYQTYSYDNLGRTASTVKYIDGNAYTHAYTYNSNGQLYTTQYPSGYVIRYEYDSYGQLKYLRNNTTSLPIYIVDSRNVLGQPVRCWFGNNTGVEYTYDAWGLPTQIQYGYQEIQWPIFNPQIQPGGDEIQDGEVIIGDDPIIVGPTLTVGNQYSVLQYSYNANGYITRKKEDKTGQLEDYTYDIQGRLTSVSVNNTQSYNYTYESNGNIRKNGLIGTSDYVYDSDKPHAVVGIDDENGVVSSSQCDVTYNSRNRPATISENGWSIELYYNNGLQREKSILKNGNTTVNTTYFISNNSEYEVTPVFSRYIDYIYAEGKIVALHVHNVTANADSIYYVQTDLLGSWDRIVDGNLNVVQSSHFDPWGNRMSATDWTLGQNGSGFQFRRGFTGHEHYDRFGIINMNARLYDPVIARFFSPDPQVQNPFSTQGFNRYSYCGNNPVMYLDEDGEFALWLAMLIGATVVGGINLGIHISQGDVNNFWQGVGYFTQGAVAGAIIGASWWGGVSLLTSGSAWGKAFAVVKGADVLSTGLSMFQNPANATRIFLGRYYFDENMAHGFSQAFTRYTWEALQTWGGYNTTQIRNLAGNVSRVDYLGGATFATNEHSSHHRGFTIGNYVNMSIHGEITMPFRDWCLYGDQMYLHEYGHTIQSQLTGFAYLFAIGLPSLISCENSEPIDGDPYQASTHDYFYTETWANRIASRYFAKYYGYEWNEHNGYPFYDYR